MTSPSHVAFDLEGIDMVSAAALTVVFYHHIITLDDEINWMWSLRMSLAKVLFIVNRYLVEAMLISNCLASLYSHHTHTLCTFLFRSLALTFVISSAVFQCVLIIRVWALFRRSSVIVAFTICSYVVGLVILLGFNLQSLLVDVVHTEEHKKFPSGLRCHLAGSKTFTALFWMTPAVVENILFILVAYKRYSWWKSGFPVLGLFSIPATDFLVYFAIASILRIVNFLLMTLAPQSLSIMFIKPSTAAACLLSSQLLLQLRVREPDPDLDSIGEVSLHFIPLNNVSVLPTRDRMGASCDTL